MSKKQFKSYVLLISYAILFYMIVIHFNEVGKVMSKVLHFLSPFISGFILAFLLNKPYCFFRNRVLSFRLGVDNKKTCRLKNNLAVVLTYMALLVFLGALIAFVIPQLADSVANLVNSIPSYTKSMNRMANSMISSVDLPGAIMEQVKGFWGDLIGKIGEFFSHALPMILDYVTGFAINVVNLAIGLIVSVYLLLGKDKLIRNVKMFVYAFLPEKAAAQAFRVGRLSSHTFGNFITGQLTDSLILGCLCFIGLTLMRMPYALLISVICACANVIPFIGPYLGAIPSALIVLMVDPWQALYFLIFILILQQIEGNIIYPKIVGDSIGISGLWVLFAILLGGELFGVLGMVAGVPGFAVIYILLSDKTKDKLKDKRIGNL